MIPIFLIGGVQISLLTKATEKGPRRKWGEGVALDSVRLTCPKKFDQNYKFISPQFKSKPAKIILLGLYHGQKLFLFTAPKDNSKISEK